MNILKAVDILREYGYIIFWVDCRNLALETKRRINIFTESEFPTLIKLAENAQILNYKHVNMI